MPVVPAALLLLACAKCTFFARKAHGCGLHPAFPAPSLFSEGETDAKLGQIVPRECEVVSPPKRRIVGWAKARQRRAHRARGGGHASLCPPYDSHDALPGVCESPTGSIGTILA